MGQGHRNTRSMAVVICLAVLLLVDIVLAAVLAVQDGTKKNPSGKEEDIVEETGGDNRDFGNTWDISGEGAGENTSAEEPPDSSADDRVEKLLAGMDLKQKVAQMFMVTPEALTGYSKVTAAGEGEGKGEGEGDCGRRSYETVLYKVSGRRRDLYGRESDRHGADAHNAFKYAGL